VTITRPGGGEGGRLSQRELRRSTTRQALAAQALRLFAERGFDDTTVEDIAAAAGVSPRTFFLHFGSKAAAAFPDHDERVTDFRARLRALDAGGDPIWQLRAMVVAGVAAQESEQRKTRYRLLEMVPALRDEDARTDRDYELAIAEFLEARWGSSPEAELRSHAAANVIIGVLRAALIAWSSSGIDPAASAAELLDRIFGSGFERSLQSVK
jgi:AcrR family transcriptional regulator